MRNRRAIRMWRRAGMLAILAVVVILPSELRAQSSQSSHWTTSGLCQTAFGICSTSPGPINAPCSCGRDPGRITTAPSNWGNTCGTSFGVCRVNYAPIGSRCTCGRDLGQIIK